MAMNIIENETPIDLEFVQGLLRQAGRIGIARQSRLDYQLKVDHSIVTHVDKDIESLLITKISKRYPTHRIISEESNKIAGKSAFTWAIDPLDGTRVYYGGLPIWCISVGIMYDNQPRWGILYLPKLDEMYVGISGKAFLNGQRLLPVVPSELDGPVAFLAVPSQCHSLFDVRIKRLRSLGSLAAHLAYVARGSAIGALTQHASIWDITAMMPILDAVGVTAKYLSGEEFRLSDLLDKPSLKPLVFAHSLVVDDICERIRMKNSSESISN